MRQPKGDEKMKIEKIKNLDCFSDFTHGAVIKTASGRPLGTTCDLGEAENIIRTYFQTEIFPESVYVFFGGDIGQNGVLGYTFRLAERR
jgi:hypothetical protein